MRKGDRERGREWKGWMRKGDRERERKGMGHELADNNQKYNSR